MPPLASTLCPDSASTSESSYYDSIEKLTKVQFVLDRNEVNLIPTLDELTPEEISRCYYSANDFKKMKSQDRVLLRLLQKGLFSPSTSQDHCLRGIEQELSREERWMQIQKVQAIVLSRRHRRDTHDDEEDAVELAEKLAKATLFSKQEALSRARGDAAAALQA